MNLQFLFFCFAVLLQDMLSISLVVKVSGYSDCCNMFIINEGAIK
jgi:hypothetical protein